MSVIPPSTALSAADYKRVAALRTLMLDATFRLQSILGDLEKASDRRYVRRRIAEVFSLLDALHSVEGGTASGALVEFARDAFPATYGVGAVRAIRDLGLQEVAAVAGNSRIHTAALESLVTRWNGEVQQKLIIPLKANALQAVRIAAGQELVADIAAGIVGGLPRTQVSVLLRRSILRAVNTALPPGTEADLTAIRVGKRTINIDTWTEMTARTELARASTAGTRVISAVNGIRHVQLTTHAHAPCICTPFEGRIYALDRGDDRFPHISEVPNGGSPLHPNCVHRETPAVVAYLEERGDVEGRDNIPLDFRGLSGKDLARKVRENKAELGAFSRKRDGVLPQTFRTKVAA